MKEARIDEKGAERAKQASIRFALEMARRPKFQDGGPVSGPLMGAHSGGRTDTLPIKVFDGSYVLPADIVSGIPGAEGNSLYGHNALTKLFQSLPYSPDEAPYGASPVPLHAHAPHFGGSAHEGGVKGHGDGATDIMAAPGEFVVHPTYVKRLGHMGVHPDWFEKNKTTPLELGHRLLDRFVKETRGKNIKTLRGLPGPVKQ